MKRYTISGTMPNYGDVSQYKISPDGRYVVYIADQETDGAYELYSAPVDGSSSPVRISQLFPANTVSIRNFTISEDSRRVVYVADQDTDDVYELYSVPVAGGTITKLNEPLTAGGDVLGKEFLISEDSSRVVYLADQETDDIYELYSVPITGGTVTKLNDPFVAGGGIFIGFESGFFLLSEDSSRVVYRADQDTLGTAELYSVPIGGGTVTKLNNALVAGGDVQNTFLISADSSRVVYRANQDTLDTVELYSVPLAGGTATKLNPQLVTGGDVQSQFLISEDSSRVVYRADQQTDNVYELYSVPLAGGTVAKLNGPLITGGDVTSFVDNPFLISEDNIRVVYTADQDTDDVFELYSAPIAGGTVTKLNSTIFVNSSIGFKINEDSSRVVYWTDQDTDDVYELYSVPITGGVVTKLNDPLVAGGNVNGNFLISDDSRRVIYHADQETDEVFELYSVPIGGGTVTKLNDPLVTGGNVLSFLLSEDSRTVVYLADQDTDDVSELFGVYRKNLLPLFMPAILSGGLQK